MSKRTKVQEVAFAFFEYLQDFLHVEQKRVYASFTPLTRKYLNYNNPRVNAKAYLRLPQFEALETYVFLKEYCHEESLWQLFEKWYQKSDYFEGRRMAGLDANNQLNIFDVTEQGQDTTKEVFNKVFSQLKTTNLSYPNYIFALTMGLGKTVLMAACIYYEFLLANKDPKNPSFCHNILVFAPDLTVLQSLMEIKTFDKSLIVPAENLSQIERKINFHLLTDAGGTLNIIDGSDFNIIISNTQKIILKKKHKEPTPVQLLFDQSSVTSQLMELASAVGLESEQDIENETDLSQNQRFQKLLRLKNLGIYVDEAHHLFGDKLRDDLMSSEKSTSLRYTINALSDFLQKVDSHLVLCSNYTGTPYANNQLLPEVVYSYGLKRAIDNRYLKRAEVYSITNVRTDTLAFVRTTITGFWNRYGTEERFENMLPKIAFFASTIEELQKELRPAVEQVLSELNIDTSKILVNVGDASITSNDDLREFKRLDTPESEKQFLLLVNKGKEGWNCRSLFAVALHREPKSKIFVLQATMRCLRQISNVQQTGLVFLSSECADILDNELQENFQMSLADFKGAGDSSPVAEVRVIPPVVKVNFKREHKLFQCQRKTLKQNVDFQLSSINMEDFSIKVTRTSIEDMNKVLGEKDMSVMRTNRLFTAYTLTAEIAKYLNESPVEINRILVNSKDGINAVVDKVNTANELLYSRIIPSLFELLFEVKEFKETENIELALVKEPTDGSDHYSVHYKEGLLASVTDPAYSHYRDKSFNVDNYCFDSKPEKSLFSTLLHDHQIKKVWFTGMLTHGQTDFYINYIDPETGSVRSYYPDFLTLNADGSYTIVEVKGDNKIDDAVVLAKRDYATQMALASGMDYQMLRGTDCEAGVGITHKELSSSLHEHKLIE